MKPGKEHRRMGSFSGWRIMLTDGGDSDLGTQLHGMHLENLLDSPSGLCPKDLVQKAKRETFAPWYEQVWRGKNGKLIQQQQQHVIHKVCNTFIVFKNVQSQIVD